MSHHTKTSRTTRAINRAGRKVLAEHSFTVKVLPYSYSEYERFSEEGDPDLVKLASYEVFGDPPGIVISSESFEHSTAWEYLYELIYRNPTLVQNLWLIVLLTPGKFEIPLPGLNQSFIPEFRGQYSYGDVPHIIFEINAYSRTHEVARRKIRSEVVAMRGAVRLGVLLQYYPQEEIWQVEVYRYITRANENGEHLILPQGLDAVERPFINAALRSADWSDTTYLQNNAAYQLWPAEDGFQIPLSAYDWFSDRFNEVSREHIFTPQTHVPLTADLFADYWRMVLVKRDAERKRQEHG